MSTHLLISCISIPVWSCSPSTMDVMGVVGSESTKKFLPWVQKKWALGMLKQWAAVTAHLDAIRVAPHSWLYDDLLFLMADAIHGYFPRYKKNNAKINPFNCALTGTKLPPAILVFPSTPQVQSTNFGTVGQQAGWLGMMLKNPVLVSESPT